MIAESQAKQDTNSNRVATDDDKDFRAEIEYPNLAKEVLAQRGGTATLPCKLSDPNAGIVSITFYLLFTHRCLMD